jgi:hypothetical protein
MNQVEQWLNILHRKRFHVADFASEEDIQLTFRTPEAAIKRIFSDGILVSKRP